MNSGISDSRNNMAASMRTDINKIPVGENINTEAQEEDFIVNILCKRLNEVCDTEGRKSGFYTLNDVKINGHLETALRVCLNQMDMEDIRDIFAMPIETRDLLLETFSLVFAGVYLGKDNKATALKEERLSTSFIDYYTPSMFLLTLSEALAVSCIAIDKTN